MKRIISSVLLGVLLLTLVAVPVLAAYYAYLTVEEANGNAYEELALTCTRNITQLVQYDLITSTGLDTRVLTGEGSPLPHMLAEDRITFTSDLDAYETKTLIFYCGATSLDSFYIIPGYDGYITTLDDADLELTYVIELLISGYFDAAVGADKNILYKEEAFRVWISAANTLKVAALEAGGGEQWSMTYDAFTTGEHTVYVVFNGMQAELYVDNFITPKDTENLWENANQQMTGTGLALLNPPGRSTFYCNGRYWCFYSVDNNTFGWRSSLDGDSWAAEQTVDFDGADTTIRRTAVSYRDGYVHLAYGCGLDIMYRRGLANADGTITWSAVWQTAFTSVGVTLSISGMAVDVDGYPFMVYSESDVISCTASSANDGTWTTAGGYPFYVSAYNNGMASIEAYYNDDMYIMYVSTTAGSHTLQGNYYNGTTWGGLHTIYSSAGHQFDWHAVSDSDGNLYVVWLNDDHAGNFDYFMKVRYSGGTWSSVTEIADAVGSLDDCTVTYNPTSDGIYIFHDKPSDATLFAYVLIGGTLIGPYTLSDQSGAIYDIEAPAYADHIGIVTGDGTGVISHQYLTYSHVWNDNANNWTWMENNVMPYGDYFTMAVDGVTQLEYEPSDIIEGTTLPDEESDHDGIITWGANPSGVTTSLTAFVDEDEAGPPFEDTIPGLTAPPDMVGPTGQPGWTADIPSLVSHPLYPAVNVISDVTGIPAKLVWILGATLLVAAAMLVCFRYAPHQLITVFVGGGLSAFFYSMDIYPFWVIFIFAVMGIAVIIGERSPTVS